MIDGIKATEVKFTEELAKKWKGTSKIRKSKTADKITMEEIDKKIEFLKGKHDLIMTLTMLGTRILNSVRIVKSAIMIQPERNWRLNRLELLFVLKELPDTKDYKTLINLEKGFIREQLLNLSDHQLVRIDYTFTTESPKIQEYIII